MEPSASPPQSEKRQGLAGTIAAVVLALVVTVVLCMLAHEHARQTGINQGDGHGIYSNAITPTSQFATAPQEQATDAEPSQQNKWWTWAKDGLAECFMSSGPADWALLIVSAFGIVYGVRTLKLLIQQTVSAEVAANAARDSADTEANALYIAESAAIHFQDLQWSFLPVSQVTIHWRNYGRTRATHVEFHIGLHATPNHREHIQDWRTVIETGQTVATVSAIIDESTAATGGDFQQELSIVGDICYTDIFTRRHKLSFTGEWIPGTEECRWMNYRTELVDEKEGKG